MSSTQPQIARSSDVATSLVFSVQGRGLIVERSSSPWRPEVFVAGMYPGCNSTELNKGVSHLSPHCYLTRARTEQQHRPEGKKHSFRSRTSCVSLETS